MQLVNFNAFIRLWWTWHFKIFQWITWKKDNHPKIPQKSLNINICRAGFQIANKHQTYDSDFKFIITFWLNSNVEAPMHNFLPITHSAEKSRFSQWNYCIFLNVNRSIYNANCTEKISLPDSLYSTKFCLINIIKLHASIGISSIHLLFCSHREFVKNSKENSEISRASRWNIGLLK